MIADRGRRLGRSLQLGATVAAALLASVMFPATAHAVPDQLIRTIQFNVSNSERYGGNVDAAADDIMGSIQDYNPHVVTLNEVCRGTYLDILARAGMTGDYIETNGPDTPTNNVYSNSCPDRHFGNAVMSVNSSTLYNAWYLPRGTPIVSQTEVRALTCITTAFLHTIRACSTHIININTQMLQNQQIRSVRDHVNRIVTTSWAVILGGDFNVIPTRAELSRIYNSVFTGGYGLFAEVAQRCGPGGVPARCNYPSTHESGNKYDYTFLSGDGGWCCPNSSATVARVSDHKVLRGSAYLQA